MSPRKMFIVDEILQRRTVGWTRGQKQKLKIAKVLVKWVGYRNPTWEPENALKHTDAYRRFENSQSHRVPVPSRRLVWETYFGLSYTHACYCCKKTKIKALGSWHRAHVIAKSKGGSNHISNLRPVCAQCNCEMATSNLYDFKILRDL